jgi:hypothetical protein
MDHPDLDPDPAIFVIDLQDANQKTNFVLKKFFCLLLFEGTFTPFFKAKKSKRNHKTEGIRVFLTIFCLMIEGSGSGPGSVPLTNGSAGRICLKILPKTSCKIANLPHDTFVIRPIS